MLLEVVEMKIRELRDFLNSLNDDVLDNKVQLDGVYNEFYEEIKLLDLDNVTLDEDDNLILEVSEIEISKSEYIGVIDTNLYEVTKLDK